jgi:hypothetical protein
MSQESRVIYKVTTPYGDSCHFGDYASAKAYSRGICVIEMVNLRRIAMAYINPETWKGLRGVTAYRRIENYAANLTEAGQMMEEWLKQNGGLLSDQN